MTIGQNWQAVQQSALPVIGKQMRETDESIVLAIDAHLNAPVRMFAANPADAKLYFEPSRVEAGDGSGKAAPPIDDTIPNSSAANIDFQTGVVSGSVTLLGAAFSLPATTVGEFRRIVFKLKSDGVIDANFSAPQAVLASLDAPGLLLSVLEGALIGWADLEATAANAFKTAGSVTSVIEHKVGSSIRVFRFGSGGGGGSGGASDFLIQTVSADQVTLKKGAIRLGDGTFLYLAANIVFNLKTDVNTGGITAPAVSTKYHLYIDRNYLPAATATGATGYPAMVPAIGTSGAFIVLATEPDDVNSSRYVHLGSIKTNGAGVYSLYDNESFRYAAARPLTYAPVVLTLGPTTLAAVGTAGNLAGGHVLDTDSFRTGHTTGTLSWWNLATNADGNANTRPLSTGGGIAFGGAVGVAGVAAGATVFDGLDDFVGSNDVFFNDGLSFTAAGWFKPTDATPGAAMSLMNKSSSAIEEGWAVLLQTSGLIAFQYPTSATTFGTITAPTGKGDGEWFHVAVTYSSPSLQWRFYIDGKLVGTAVQANRVVLAYNSFLIGTRYAVTQDYFAGAVDEAMYDKRTYTVEEIFKLSAVRIELPYTNLEPGMQRWEADLNRGAQIFEYDDKWLAEKQRSRIYARFDGLSTDTVTMRLLDIGLQVNTAPVRPFYRRLVASPGVDGVAVPHGLGEIPTAFAILHNEMADGRYAPVNPYGYIKADATNLYLYFSPLTIAVGTPVIVIAAVGASALAVPVSHPVIITTAANAQNNDDLVTDSTGGSFVVTLPSLPQVGDTVRVRDGFNQMTANPVTVARNGQLIEGAAADFSANTDGAEYVLVYVAGAIGWKVYT